MPIQLLTFLRAVEKACGLSMEEHEAFALRLKQRAEAARSCGGKPERDRHGDIKWKRTLPFAM